MFRISKFRLVVLAIVCIAAGFYFLSSGINSFTATPVDVCDIHYFQVKEGGFYRTQELFIIDSFASMEKSSTHYFLAVFFDQNDAPVAVDMAVSSSDPIYSRLINYASDDSQSIGDCVLDCYVRAQADTMSDSSQTAELHRYFEESIATYEDVLEMSFHRAGVRFTYCCDGMEDPQSVLRKEGTLSCAGGLALLAVAAGILVLTFRRRKSAQPSAVKSSHPQAENLKSLLDAGMLTQEEYSRKIAELSGERMEASDSSSKS